MNAKAKKSMSTSTEERSFKKNRGDELSSRFFNWAKKKTVALMKEGLAIVP
jgi:hypothetical protein